MRKIRKIAFLGNFRIDYCTEVHHARTYEKLGIEVVRFQESHATGYEILERLKQGDIDAFCHTHTHNWGTDGIEEVLSYCRMNGIPTYGYHLDLWLGIERQKDLETDTYWKQLDYFFSVDPEMVDYLNSHEGMPKAFYLPAGVFEDECYMAEPNREKYPHDIIFVGSKDYHPEWPYRPQLIEWLQKTYGERFKLYGREEGKNFDQIRGHELNVLYASAKIVIGDTLCPGFNKPGYFSDRIFETTGRGGFIIHPYISGIKDLFEINEYSSEIATYIFNDFDALKQVIDFFLVAHELREHMRTKAFWRTKRDHTYTRRLTKLIDTLENDT